MSMFHELMMKKKGIPSRYQEVEYLESTGTQYIDTGLKGNSDTGLKIDVQYLNTNDTVAIGSRVSSGTDTRFFIGMSSTGFYLAWNSLGSRPTYNLNKNTLSMNYLNDKKAFLNDTLVNSISSDLSNQSYNICLFACGGYNISLFSTIRLYSAQITQGNRLVRNFIPVYDTLTQKYGMWETVQGKFYGNAGTGDFKGSIVGYTVVGSPTIVDGVVSGLTQSNYIKLSEKIQNIDWQNLHIHTEFEVSSLPSTAVVFCIGAYNIKFNVRSGNYLYFQYRALSAPSALQTAFSNTSVIPLNSNITVELDCIKDTSAHLVVKSGTNILWEFSTSDFTINGNDDFLYGTDITYFGGNNLFINLNNTYIKINNKLWFNGQQA